MGPFVMPRIPSALPVLLGLTVAPVALGQPTVPRRQIPASVLAELHQVSSRFELALANDCDATRCFPKGCVYVDHAVIDRPRRTSLPGLGGDPGPGSIEPQEFLTRATCSFAHEDNVTDEEAQSLVRRLQSKASSGFVVVSVQRQALQPLPAHLRDVHVPEPEEEEAPPPPPPAPERSWLDELWATLLPHTAWMIGVLLATFSATVLFWAWRRVGKESLEEQLLLAELARGGDAPAPPDDAGAPDDDVADDFVIARAAAWNERLSSLDADAPDPELQALARELLASGDLPLLAKAALTLPAGFLATFPAGGDLARAKLDLADYLKTVDADALPDDEAFYRALDRHALAASLASQADASLVRSVQQDFGAAGLVGLIRELPARPGALLFALAPSSEQREMVRLLSAAAMADLCEQLLASNRMSPAESEALFAVLEAARRGAPLPAVPSAAVTDRGGRFDAAGALSILLAPLSADTRSALLGAALRRFGGTAPAWYRGILTPDMLLALPDEARADLLLEVDTDPLAAWLSVQADDEAQRLRQALPRALRVSLDGVGFASPTQQASLAERGREALATGLQRQLVRQGVRFEALLQPPPPRAEPA